MLYVCALTTGRGALSRQSEAQRRAIRREETMKPLRSSRQLIKMWHRREKVTIDHLVRSIGPAKNAVGTTHSAFTSSGLAVEDQIRKAWRPGPMGLAIF